MTLVSLVFVNLLLLHSLSSIKSSKEQICVINLNKRGSLNAEDTSKAALTSTINVMVALAAARCEEDWD